MGSWEKGLSLGPQDGYPRGTVSVLGSVVVASLPCLFCEQTFIELNSFLPGDREVGAV
jgi:hypothetical protein